MNTEVRFLLAIGLMLLVLIGTNVLFPPIETVPPGGQADSVAVTGPGAAGDGSVAAVDAPTAPAPAGDAAGGEGVPTGDVTTDGAGAPDGSAPTPAPERPEGRVVVEGPLYRYTFTDHGARVLSAELLRFESLRRDGPVELVPPGADGLFGTRLVVGSDTVDLRSIPFEAEPSGGLTLEAGGAARDLSFVYRHPTSGFAVTLTYTFDPDTYVVALEGEVEGVDRALVLTELGSGLAFNEADSTAEASLMAWVGNHAEEGIDSHELRDIEERRVYEGPFRWVALKSKFFVMAVLPAGGDLGATGLLGGVITERTEDGETRVTAAKNLGADRSWEQQLFVGPQDYARLSALGTELEEVNPYGWRFLRPVLRPIVEGILWCLNFLHNTLNIGYGWVLILFGVLMRVVLWPFNQKAMRAQLRNMQVQPMLKEIQEKYKDNPERLQKEMMRLYKEYGFNPLAGCLPMLLPWPVLIALFFVFQNTIELRGVEFLWLPDLSAKDPLYILPLFLAVSMFALQWISYKSLDQDNPQMKMMMWFMPLFMGFIFMQFASGLNLYYATANIATIPQQFWIANEREKAKEKGPVKLDQDE